ncbi:HAMP domain-containing sensor histidine kinase [Clostridium tunisiense]|uniref:HAMP domain-containing sensor histidine kinase n=1 Tax=Clostridium tunisiense TaxID=219748 RepID=UPI00031651A7|nr:HAMP domain-containing sensor histidine kinase [Clostridium tunisiense]
MTIKSRLRLTYIAMIIIPFILIAVISNIFLNHVVGKVEEGNASKFEKNTYKLFTEVITSNNKFQKKVNRQILQDPDKIVESEYLLELEKTSTVSNTGIVLVVNNKIIYESELVKDYIKVETLPPFNSEKKVPPGEGLYILGQQDFYLKDGSESSIFYIVNLETFKRIYRESSFIILIFSLIILILTNMMLSYWTSRTLVKPLKELEKAANEIKQGNLDYNIKINSKDEIAQLSQTFEEMRLRLKESLELQQQYEENRRELISNISHDLKTPITSIKGYVEGIKDGVADTPEKMDKYVTTIYTKAIYMDNLINDLFLFSKLDLNKENFKYQRVDMVSYIKDCVDEISFDLDTSEVELTSILPEKLIYAEIDVQQIKRTIMNIVGNSIKYKKDEKLKVDIILSESKDYITVEIKDNGKGIPEESLSYIFERFYRSDVSRGTTVGGTGLGLAIAKKIIEEHKGKIWAESELGEGTSIFFSLKSIN